MALRMIEEAERAGTLVPGESVLVEPSAGNTGAALAWISLIKVPFRLLSGSSTNVITRQIGL